MTKILYISWGEWMQQDILDVLRQMKIEVTAERLTFHSYDHDEELETKLEERIKHKVDAVFTMDYIPLVSNVCQRNQVRYIAWISDCPNLTLYSKTIQNDCNRIFTFDLKQLAFLKQKGAVAYSMPLGVNTKRLQKTVTDVSAAAYTKVQDLAFVGSFYQDDNNHLDQIQGLSEETRGFLEGVIQAQLLVYGYDLVEKMMTGRPMNELVQRVGLEENDGYYPMKAEVIRNFIRTKVTMTERAELLKSLGMLFSLSIASPKKPADIRANDLGYVHYYSQMPQIFRKAKINYNFTLRSIQSGIPLRVTDVLGAGGFLITNYQPEMGFYFENHRDLVWFDSRENLLDLTAYYLKHDTERKKIAENGQKIAANVFSYERLLKKIIDTALTEG